MDWQPTTDTAYNFPGAKRTSSNGTEPHPEPEPRDELLYLAGLLWSLAGLLLLAWVWGWV